MRHQLSVSFHSRPTQHLLVQRQHLLVQRQVCHDPCQLRVLFFQLAQAPQFDWVQAAVLLLPAVERGFTDSEFATDFRRRDATIGLLNANTICDSGPGLFHGNRRAPILS
jgi:hypothetical protein